jgi:hypothetical protein
MPQQRKGSVVAAFGWMLVLSIILGIFLPTIGPFIAGLVGGARAGSIKNALLAALVPAILTFPFHVFNLCLRRLRLRIP